MAFLVCLLFRESIGVAITKSFVIFVRKFFVSSIYRKFTANSSMWGSLRLAPIILDECRTLWGEPERVQLSNVHGAVA